MGGSHSPSIETPATCQIQQTLCPCDESNNQSDVYGLFSLYDFEFINAFISAFVGNGYGIFADFRQGFAYFVFDSFVVQFNRYGRFFQEFRKRNSARSLPVVFNTGYNERGRNLPRPSVDL